MDLPWPTITAASGGWLLTAAFVWALISGRIVTRREADEYVRRAEKAEGNVEKLIATMAETTGVGKLQRKVLDAAAEAVEPESAT